MLEYRFASLIQSIGLLGGYRSDRCKDFRRKYRMRRSAPAPCEREIFDLHCRTWLVLMPGKNVDFGMATMVMSMLSIAALQAAKLRCLATNSTCFLTGAPTPDAVVLSNDVRIHLYSNGRRPMSIGAIPLNARHPVLFARLIVVVVTANSLSSRALQSTTAIVDRAAALRERDPTDSSGNAIDVAVLVLDVHHAALKASVS